MKSEARESSLSTSYTVPYSGAAYDSSATRSMSDALSLGQDGIVYRQGGIVEMWVDKRIAVASDTHFGNVFEAFREYQKFCDIARRSGAVQLYLCGDVAAGLFEHPKYASRLHKSTARAQADYIIDNYPKGLETYWIKGNHDPLIMEDGEEMQKYIGMYRKDMHFLGYHSVRIIDPRDDFIMDLRHSNGNARKHGKKAAEAAKMWKEEMLNYEKPDWSQPKDINSKQFSPNLKRYIRGIPEDQRPDMLLSGHVHDNWESLYNGIYVIAAGCFVKFNHNGKGKAKAVTNGDNCENGNGDQPVCGFIVNMERKNGRLKSVTSQKVFNF